MQSRNSKPVPSLARQHGAITVLTLFIMLMTIGALGVLGLGQVVWEREQVQRIADLVAKVAASDIDGATGGFQVAREHAVRNGLKPETDSIEINCNVKGSDLPLAPANCQLSVLVKVIRNVPAAFLGTEPVTAVAEATLSPVVSGIVGTRLLSANLNSGAPGPLLDQLGVKLGLELGGVQGLLRSNLEVDLQKLAKALAVPGSDSNFNLGSLLNRQVSARELIERATEVAGLPGAGLGNMNSPTLGTAFPLSRIISGQQAVNANIPAASVRLGDLVFAATLSAASFLPEDSLQLSLLGDAVRVSVQQPPQIFLAVKSPSSTAVLATARTEQVKLTTKINGVVDLSVVAGGGEVDIRDIECRLPQSSSAVAADVRSSVVKVELDLPSLSAVNALGFITVPSVNPPPIDANLSSQSNSGLRLEGYPNPILQSSYSFEAQQGLPDLLSQIDSDLVDLQSLLTVLAVNSPVRLALAGVGQRLDGLLGLAGLDVNEVVVQVNRMDCFRTAVLTR